MIKKTKLLISKIKPFLIETENISFSNSYFQSVFIRVKPTAVLMEANLNAQKDFMINQDFYMPHISLLYGNQPLALREKITKEISFSQIKFAVTTISVVFTPPNFVNKWRSLFSFKLFK